MRPATSVSNHGDDERSTARAGHTTAVLLVDRTEPTWAHVRLRDDHFVRVTNFLGHGDDAKRARFCEVDYNTLRRARSGGNLSQSFIDKTLTALKPHRQLLAQHSLDIDFDALFETVEVPA